MPENKNLPVKSPEIIEKFLDQQSQQIQVKKQELEIQKQENEYSFEYSKKALDAQIKDSEQDRVYINKAIVTVSIFIGSMILIGLVFMGFALYLDKDQVVMEIIKSAVLVLGGGAGGYAIGKSRKRLKSSDLSEDE